MTFPGYTDYGSMAWMMFGSVVLWVALITLAVFVVLKLMARARFEGDDALV